jgi:hypothetical protein
MGPGWRAVLVRSSLPALEGGMAGLGEQTRDTGAGPQDLPKPVYVTQRYAVSQSQEPGVVISMRDYDRLIERLDGCKTGGWADLWLFGAGAGAALAAGALVTALTLSVAQSGLKNVLWVLTGAGAVVLVLRLVGYLTQRRDHGREISELKKDLEIHKPRSRAT